MPTSKRPIKHRKAYSYVNKHGKVVHVKEHGIASIEAASEPSPGRRSKLTDEQWCQTMQTSLDEWAQALGHSENFGIYNAETGAHLNDQEIKRFLKVHGKRLRANGFYLLNRAGKVLPPTQKQLRKKLPPEAWAARLRMDVNDWVQGQNIPEGPGSWLDRRDAFLEQQGIQLYSVYEGSEHPTDLSVDAWMALQPERQKAWLKQNKAKFLAKGIPLIDLCGNPLSAPPKQLPSPPITQHNANERLRQACRQAGFENLYLSPETRRSPMGLATAQSLIKALHGLRTIFDIPANAGHDLHLKVDTIEHAMTAATYSRWNINITLDSERGSQTFYHEFGHFLDHFIGSPDLKRPVYATNAYGNVTDDSTPEQKAARDFVLACQKCPSYAAWANDDREHQKGYFREPTEMFARFFDTWCGERLKEKGLNPYAYSCSPFWYPADRGGFSREDFDALRPLFERVIEARIKKAFATFLRKARTAGAKGKAPKLGKYGALLSTDPTFYPAKGGMRYLSASEAGRAADMVTRYAKRGIAVTYQAPLGHILPATVEAEATPQEAALAQGVVTGLDSLKTWVAGGSMPDDTALQGLPDIGVDPKRQPVAYLLSMGWSAQDDHGDNRLTAQQTKALLTEFEPTIHHAISRVAKRLRSTPAQRRELHSDAALFVLEAARAYRASERGPPGKGHNFAALLQGSLPKRLAGDVMEIQQTARQFDSYTEEPDRDAGDSLRIAAMHARIETPEQRLRREDLSQTVSQALDKVLSPVEHATVISRLNILNAQSHGISDDMLSTGLRVGGLKPWHAVKEDVLQHLNQVGIDPIDLVRLQSLLLRVPPGNFRVIFERSMDKLRDPSGLSESERDALRELADLQRLYLEGVRHETFDPEHAGKLQTQAPAPPKVSLQHLSDSDQTRAFWQVHAALAASMHMSPKRAQRYFRLAQSLQGQSTDALRARLRRQPPAGVRPEDYARIVGWALQGSIQKALGVIPLFSDAWSGLVEECTVWALNGW